MMEITQEGRELAVTYANGTVDHGAATAGNITHTPYGLALARLATQSLADKAALAELQASYDAAVGDLREIDEIARGGCWDKDHSPACRTRIVAAIAAKYREVDPLLIEARKLAADRHKLFFPQDADEIRSGARDGCDDVVTALIALKRGIELAKVQTQ